MPGWDSHEAAEGSPDRSCVEDLAPAPAGNGSYRGAGGVRGDALFETMLTPIGNLAGGAKLEGLLDELRMDRKAQLHGSAAEAAAIHETCFFRDAGVFDRLRVGVLPKLVEARRREKRFRVWCAGCSSGQEAYSVAMLLAERFPELDWWDVRVLGTDVSAEAVERARLGWYGPAEVRAGLTGDRLVRFLRGSGAGWEVEERLREVCSFECWNLCEPFPELPQFDLVLMRNVLPYMDAECRAKVFEHVRQQMADDGVLILGRMERADEASGSFDEELDSACSLYRPSVAG
jgi:chemotaxis protein methyltransferase CheR